MVSRFFYMLALVFAFQMTFGVASAYCMHETGKASEHFGHHPHVHKDASGDKDKGSAKAKAGFDPDCASCAHGSIVMPMLSVESAMAMPAEHDLAPPPARLTSPYLGLPERPNWTRAA